MEILNLETIVLSGVLTKKLARHIMNRTIKGFMFGKIGQLEYKIKQIPHATKNLYNVETKEKTNTAGFPVFQKNEITFELITI